MRLETELNTLIHEFIDHIEWFNKNRKQPLEDDIQPTFMNFAEWLEFEEKKYKQNI